MQSIQISERRHYRRYIVQGPAALEMDAAQITGEIVNISAHGVLMRANAPVGDQSEFKLTFSVPDYPVTFECQAKVLGTNDGLISCGFTTEPPRLQQLLLWLAENNYPWTVNYASDLLPSGSQRELDDASGQDAEIQALLSQLHQLG